jgi:hypothetical protein
MSPAQALQLARSAGIKVKIDGENLLLEALAPPPAAVLDLLSHHKTAILTMLRPGVDGWSAEDWQIFFEERASILEFEGALQRPQAEEHAFACCIRGMVESQSRQFDAGALSQLRQWESPGRSIAAVWDREERSCMAAWDVLAGMASVAARRGHCSAASNRHSGMRTW